jgi:beta-lactamase class D
VKEIMVTDSTDCYTIRSKTGWAKQIGWNVGCIEAKGNTWIFAMNIDMKNMREAKYRKQITYDILKEEGIIK